MRRLKETRLLNDSPRTGDNKVQAENILHDNKVNLVALEAIGFSVVAV